MCHNRFLCSFCPRSNLIQCGDPQQARVAEPDRLDHLAVSGRVAFPFLSWCPAPGLSGAAPPPPPTLHPPISGDESPAPRDLRKSRESTRSAQQWRLAPSRNVTSDVRTFKEDVIKVSDFLSLRQEAPEEISYGNILNQIVPFKTRQKSNWAVNLDHAHVLKQNFPFPNFQNVTLLYALFVIRQQKRI